MKELHLFKPFIPQDPKYLLLGTFTAPLKGNNQYEWYYCTKRNQFWSIVEAVYDTELESVSKKQELFARLKIAITDTILKCERVSGNSSDSNLENLELNSEVISEIIDKHNIEAIFFTSKFASSIFLKNFKEYSDIKKIVLPSPSPRYARISKEEKIEIYKKLLPKI